MKRCIQLAKNGLGSTYPNPMVGCVIVHDNQIIGEGWHYKAGSPHAEVNAISSIENKELLKDSTLYVSLEPCSHFGKTPPCSDLIIESGIKNVVVGSLDPNPKVAGEGIRKLKTANCSVTSGILKAECAELNKRFFTFYKNKRPYILLKWARSTDGFIAPNQEKRGEIKEPVWISNPYSRQLAHKMRAEEQSILVGTQTVLDDNPSLTTRDWQGSNAIRILIDRNLKIPKDSLVLDGKTKTVVITEKKASNLGQTIFETLHFSEELPQQICDILYKHEIQSVLIEGGSKTLQSFIDANLWDEAFVFTGEGEFEDGIKAPILNNEAFSKSYVKKDVLHHYKNRTS